MVAASPAATAASATDWPGVADHFVVAWQATPAATQISALLALVLIVALLSGRVGDAVARLRGGKSDDAPTAALHDAYSQVIEQILVELTSTMTALRDAVERYAESLDRHTEESAVAMKSQAEALSHLARTVVDLGSDLPNCARCDLLADRPARGRSA